MSISYRETPCNFLIFILFLSTYSTTCLVVFNKKKRNPNMRSIIDSSIPTKIFILGSFLQIAGNLVGGKQTPSFCKNTDENIATNRSQVAGAAIGALGEAMQSLAITVPSLPMLYRWSNAVPLTGNVTSRTMESLGKSVLLLGGVSITVAACILPIARRAYFLFL